MALETAIQSSYVKPQFLVIELEGCQKWFDNLQGLVKYDLCLSEMMEFYLVQFQKRQEAILNLEYSLIEMYGENNFSGILDRETSTILNETRKLGIKLLNYLDLLGCFQNDNLSYCFATVLAKDTFMFWRPTSNDIHY